MGVKRAILLAVSCIAIVSVAAGAAAPASDRVVVNRWLRGMTLRDKIAQMVIVACFGEDPAAKSKDFTRFAHYVKDLHVGGFIVVNRVVGGQVRNAEPHAMASFLNRMQRLSTKVPLIMAGDFERGASMRVAGTAKFPHLMAYGAAGDPALTRQLGLATARESRALGIQWVFAPDADVNNNPDNPIINTRSFGEDPKLVAEHVKAFIEGAHSDPRSRVLVTAKHFPGHGDTSVDSHLNLPVLNADKARLTSTELVPFEAAAAGGVDAIMTAHMSVPALDPEGVPATVSPRVLTGVIRDSMKFNGLIVTDAMDMQGLIKQYPPGEAAVHAIEAGADVLLMPADPDVVVNAVHAAVRDGRLTEKRITESVNRILAAKARVGLQRQKLVNIEEITDTIEDPEFTEQAQTAANRAVTLVKNEKNTLPLASPAGACFWVLSDSRYGQSGRRFVDEIRQRARDARVSLLDPQVSQADLDALVGNSQACTAHIIAASTGNNPKYRALVESLQKSSAPTVVVALGSPYILRSYPGANSYVATFSSAPTAEVAAVMALLGEIPMKGRMPVTIPGIM